MSDSRAALARERARARHEGLWTRPDTVRAALRAPPEDNAAPLIRAAIHLDRARGRSNGDAVVRVLQDRARLWDAKTIRNDDLTAWRVASRRPRLDFDREWALGPDLLFPEYAQFKGVAKRLCASALIGSDPGEELATVTRLAGLATQEPTFIAQFIAISMVKIARRTALRLGLSLTFDGCPSLMRPLRLAFEFPTHSMIARYAGESWRILDARRMPPEAVARHAMRLLRLHRKLWLAVKAAHGDVEREAAAYVRYADASNHYIRDHRLLGASLVPVDRKTQIAQTFVDFERAR